jgi:hypothetical protein
MALSWYNGFSPDVRMESYRWLQAEIAAGRIEPPSGCQVCGQTDGHLDYHTEDYSRPFGANIHAYQLCFLCHMTLHVRHRMPANWQSYIESLEAGAIYRPLLSRREIGRVWDPGWVGRPLRCGTPRPRLEFFRSLVVGKSVTAVNPDQGRLFET